MSKASWSRFVLSLVCFVLFLNVTSITVYAAIDKNASDNPFSTSIIIEGTPYVHPDEYETIKPLPKSSRNIVTVEVNLQTKARHSSDKGYGLDRVPSGGNVTTYITGTW